MWSVSILVAFLQFVVNIELKLIVATYFTNNKSDLQVDEGLVFKPDGLGNIDFFEFSNNNITNMALKKYSKIYNSCKLSNLPIVYNINQNLLNGHYYLVLMMMEHYYQSSNLRIISISLNDITVEKKLDLFNKVGYKKPFNYLIPFKIQDEQIEFNGFKDLFKSHLKVSVVPVDKSIAIISGLILYSESLPEDMLAEDIHISMQENFPWEIQEKTVNNVSNQDSDYSDDLNIGYFLLFISLIIITLLFLYKYAVLDIFNMKKKANKMKGKTKLAS